MEALKVSKRLRGGDFRHAVEAVAAWTLRLAKPTGLLDLKALEEAIERIRRRQG